MKKILFILLMLVSITAFAENDVTKFLGIPVDGFKQDMIQKLKAKGYRYNAASDCLTGEFNGSDVEISVATNNNKVWRIMVVDANYSSETDIKIKFNKLVGQFQNNKKYMSGTLTDQMLSEKEDISYEMLVNKKRFQAYFFQFPADTLALRVALKSHLAGKFTLEQIEHPSEKEQQEMVLESTNYLFDIYAKKIVWFMINEEYGKYRIIMYYDNEYNHSNGEDL
ncbi:MAG: hypothetical protein E7070_06610 [Bacteroidales bacterium]|nr:hypothetical protein [Bacteroidales bacterium]